MSGTGRVYTRLAGAMVLLPGFCAGGCYKSEYDAEKARTTELEKRATEQQAALDKATADLQAALNRATAAEGQLAAARSSSRLVLLADGRPGAEESIHWDGQRWVRHGECIRGGTTVRFDNGRLVDQSLVVTSAEGLPLVAGQVHNSAPDGEWIWFDAAGKPRTKEVWKERRLADVYRATTASGVLAWERLGRRDREAWVNASENSLRDIPELRRDTSSPPAAPAPAKPARQ